MSFLGVDAVFDGASPGSGPGVRGGTRDGVSGYRQTRLPLAPMSGIVLRRGVAAWRRKRPRPIPCPLLCSDLLPEPTIPAR